LGKPGTQELFDKASGMGRWGARQLGDEAWTWYKAQQATKQGVAEGSLGNVLPWPVVANKINSAMKAMGWKGQRKGDDSYLFSTKGAEDESQYYMVMIDNEGNGMFTYALGTWEEGRPDIGEQDTLPTTEASVSEVLMAIRDGYGLNDQSVAEEWSKKYKSSINCSHPKGFSQKAHCAGKKKHNESIEMEMTCEDCGMCQTHGNNMLEVKQRLDAKCWKGFKKQGTKMKGGTRVNNCVPVSEGVGNIMDVLINKIIVNEAIQNNRK
jgi:hypothetical protein